VAQKLGGQACGAASECVTGFCADGVCCEAACTGTCKACTLAKNGQASGLCRDVVFGTDPDGECGAATCVGFTSFQPKSTCALGACSVEVSEDCGAYRCNAASVPEACFTSCFSDAQCDTGAGFSCVGGVCVVI
jgi:hypothetical protein